MSDHMTEHEMAIETARDIAADDTRAFTAGVIEVQRMARDLIAQTERVRVLEQEIDESLLLTECATSLKDMAALCVDGASARAQLAARDERIKALEAALAQGVADGNMIAERDAQLAVAVGALKGVVRVADRATVEFDAARSAISNLPARAKALLDVAEAARKMAVDYGRIGYVSRDVAIPLIAATNEYNRMGGRRQVTEEDARIFDEALRESVRVIHEGEMSAPQAKE